MREIAAEQRRRQQKGIMHSNTPQTHNTSYFQNTRKEVTASRPGPSNYPTHRPMAPQHRPQEKPLPPGDPMDINRLRKKNPANSRVRCFQCRGFGHVQRNCPVKSIRKLDEDQINSILKSHWTQCKEGTNKDPSIWELSWEEPPKVILKENEEDTPEDTPGFQ